MVGACLGRAAGQLVKFYVKDSVFSGAYALAGAAAMLGGVQRATISLVVIIIEGTANVHFLLPIVVTTCTAKLVGNLFGHEGVYEIGLRRKKLRFLEHEPSWEMDLCTAADVMSRPPVTFAVVVRVGEIIDKLRMCQHNGFPVVSMDDEGDPSFAPTDRSSALGDGLHECKFEGLILRSQLLHILSTRFMEDGLDPDALWYKVTAASLEEVDLDGVPALYDLMAYNTRVTAKALADLSDADRARWINIGAYMNCACYTIMESCPLSRAYKLFRDMGLRHLPVLDIQNRVVGMLARANFDEETLHRVVRTYYRRVDKIYRAQLRTAGMPIFARAAVG
jgi:CBS domain-containing protein